MGAFFGSTQVWRRSREDVLAAAQAIYDERQIKSFVSRAKGDWTGIFPEHNGQDHEFGQSIAQRLGGTVLHVLVHDSDVMAYWLWEERQLVDSYWSRPGYFGEKDQAVQMAMAGRPEAFRPIVGDKVKRLAKILDRSDSPLLEEDRLMKFARVLRLAGSQNAYEYIAETKTWPARFTQVPPPDPAIAEAAKREKEAVVRRFEALCQSLKDEGLLLHREMRDTRFRSACAAGNDFLVAWNDFPGGPSDVQRLRGPGWQPIPIAAPSHVNTLAGDPRTGRVFVLSGDVLRAYQVESDGLTLLREIVESSFMAAAAFTSDFRVLAYRTQNRVVALNVESSQELLSAPSAARHPLAMHPSGKWLASVAECLKILPLNGYKRGTLIFPGGREKGDLSLALVRQRLAGINLGQLKAEMQGKTDKHASEIARMLKSTTPEQLAEIKAGMQKSVDESLAKLSAMTAGNSVDLPPRSRARLVSGGFTRDGNWLWCGSDMGLHVYQFTLPGNDQSGPTIVPKWNYRFALPPSRLPGFIHAVVETNDQALVFGDTSGVIRRLSLADGSASELIKLPGESNIWGLCISADGQSLGVSGSFDAKHIKHGQNWRSTFDIWSYPRLLELAGTSTP